MSVEKVTLTGASETLNAGWTKHNTNVDYLVCGDGAGTRYLRAMKVAIKNGTTAETIKPSGTSIYNSDAVTEENNLGQSGDTGNFSLDATKSKLHISADGITGTVTNVLMASIIENASGNVIHVDATVVSSGIQLEFTHNDASAYDLTEAVDVGEIYVQVMYLTSS